MNNITIHVQLTGIRPLMFDRYAGDNNTQLPVGEKMYLNDSNGLVIPAVNIFSMLAAENTKSVCRQFMGKQGKTLALGIASYVSIQQWEIPILDDGGQIHFTGFGDKIKVHKAVARVKGGIPNPKERPVIATPWRLEFDVDYIENKYCTIDNLRDVFSRGGSLGLGTFRPYFGTYQLTQWKEA